MRQRAQAAGNLASTPQEAVSYDQGYIQVAPVNPQVVYLPAYDPWTVYGQPIQPYRGFSLLGGLGSFFGSSFGSSAVRFGLGIAMSAFSHTSFGWLGWGLDWLTHSLLFHNSNYYSHSTTVADWGLPHGGPRAAFRHDATARSLPGNSFRPQDGYARPGGVSDSHGAYSGYNRFPGQGLARPADRYEGNRAAQGSYRSYESPGVGYARPPMEAYNGVRPQLSRPQTYSRPVPGYGSGFYRAPANSLATRPSPPYNTAQLPYRAPLSGFSQRSEFPDRSSGYRGSKGFDGYSEKQPKSGGFHLFGGSHESKSFGGERNFKSHHSDGGGHSGHGGGKHHR
jgi:hypothetical protein